MGTKVEAENVCEHGDHPAPAGKRFCSWACQACEHDTFGKFGCTGLCERLKESEARASLPSQKAAVCGNCDGTGCENGVPCAERVCSECNGTGRTPSQKGAGK